MDLSVLFVSDVSEVTGEGGDFVVAECFVAGHVGADDAKFDDTGRAFVSREWMKGPSKRCR